MNNRISIIAVLLSVITMMTSCLKDDSEIVTYDDAAITSFSLGTLKRVLNTKTKAGKDTVIQTTVSCVSYAFTIDQEKGLIYNVDSLPIGTVAAKALVNINTLNSGHVFIKSLTSDSLFAYTSSSDSLDFSKPRELQCLANDGQHVKKYTVDVRVHTEARDSFYWKQLPNSTELAALENMRAINAGNRIMVCGTVNGTAKLYSSAQNDGNAWTEHALPFASQPTMTACGNTLYCLTDGTLYTANVNEGSLAFTEVAKATGLRTLIAATATEITALSDDNTLMVSHDEGKTWNADNVGDDVAYLPLRDINGIRCPIQTNKDVDKIVLIGNRGIDTDKTCVVWSKVVDNGIPSRTENWIFQPFYSTSTRPAPSLDHLTVTPYNNGMLMIGGNGIGACELKALSKMYFSTDNGQTWYNDARFALPKNFDSSATSFAMVSDSNNYLWIIGGTSGQVWRGHLAQLVWE